MRPFLSVVLILSLTYCGFAQALPPGEVVPTGSGIEIDLLENISSESLKAGQSVSFKLVHALEVNGGTLLPAGTQFSGTVTSVNSSGHWRNCTFGSLGAYSYAVEVRFESEFSGCKRFIFVDVNLKRVLCADRDNDLNAPVRLTLFLFH
jgi:hypothetical protein